MSSHTVSVTQCAVFLFVLSTGLPANGADRTVLHQSSQATTYLLEGTLDASSTVRTFSTLEVLKAPDPAGVRSWRSIVQVDCFSAMMRWIQRVGYPDAEAARPAATPVLKVEWQPARPDAAEAVRRVCLAK